MSKDRRENTLITVIVPVYNVEKYLPQSLDSVITQSHQNLEILVVDDGSTDLSGKICDEYENLDSRITVYHTANHGLSEARNYALDRATGDYITFLDSDDWLEKRAYETLLEEALRTDADIVTCRFFQEYVNGTEESAGPVNTFVVQGDDVLRTYLLGQGISHDAWNKLYKASVFETTRYPKGRIFEDIATTYLILQKTAKLAYLPDCLIHYRNRQNSLSDIHSMKSLVDYWLAYRERFDVLSPLSDEYYRLSLAESLSAVSRMWRWYAGCTKDERVAAQKYLDETQRFVLAHRAEVEHDRSYSRHARLTCAYTRSQNHLLLKALYHMTLAYRKVNHLKKYEA